MVYLVHATSMDALTQILAKGFKQGPSGSGDPESDKSGFGVFAELLENAKYCTTYAVYSMPLPHNGFIMAPVIEFRAPKCVVTNSTRLTFAGRVFSELVSAGLVGNLRPAVIQALAHQKIPDEGSKVKAGFLNDSDPGVPGRNVADPRIVIEPTLGSRGKDKQLYPSVSSKVDPDLKSAPRVKQEEYCNQPCSVWHYMESWSGKKYYFNCKRFCKKYDRNHHTCDCNCYSNAVPPWNDIEWLPAAQGGSGKPPADNTYWFTGSAKSDPTPGQKYKKRRQS